MQTAALLASLHQAMGRYAEDLVLYECVASDQREKTWARLNRVPGCSVAVLAEISLRSPQKIFIYIIKKCTF